VIDYLYGLNEGVEKAGGKLGNRRQEAGGSPAGIPEIVEEGG
jgi:hypothetical protein